MPLLLGVEDEQRAVLGGVEARRRRGEEVDGEAGVEERVERGMIIGRRVVAVPVEDVVAHGEVVAREVRGRVADRVVDVPEEAAAARRRRRDVRRERDGHGRAALNGFAARGRRDHFERDRAARGAGERRALGADADVNR